MPECHSDCPVNTDLAPALQAAHQAVYVLGRAHARLRTDSNWLRRYCLELPFQVLVTNVQTDADRAFGIPAERVCEVGLLYEV